MKKQTAVGVEFVERLRENDLPGVNVLEIDAEPVRDLEGREYPLALVTFEGEAEALCEGLKTARARSVGSEQKA